MKWVTFLALADDYALDYFYEEAIEGKLLKKSIFIRYMNVLQNKSVEDSLTNLEFFS